eukprot:SAG11_NODE_3515_length_2398_cov_7.547629_2_plen_80_part_00
MERGSLLAQDVPAKRVTLKKLRKMVQGRGFLYKEYQRELVEHCIIQFIEFNHGRGVVGSDKCKFLASCRDRGPSEHRYL